MGRLFDALLTIYKASFQDSLIDGIIFFPVYLILAPSSLIINHSSKKISLMIFMLS